MNIKNMIFLLYFIPGILFAGPGGNIGTYDRRTYSNLSDPDYNSIVQIKLQNGTKSICTGGFISKNFFITNLHCAKICEKSGCKITFYDGTKWHKNVQITRKFYGHDEYETVDGRDWAIFRSSVPNPKYKQIAPNSTIGSVKRGGFGTLRIIKDDEIPTLKMLLATTRMLRNTECKSKPKNYTKCIMDYFNTALKANNIPVLTGDTNRFKIQTCNIKSFFSNKKMLQTDCDSSGGDSGAPLIRGNKIVGLNNSGPQNIFNKNDNIGAAALNTNNFYTWATNYINKNKNLTTKSISTDSDEAELLEIINYMSNQ